MLNNVFNNYMQPRPTHRHSVGKMQQVRYGLILLTLYGTGKKKCLSYLVGNLVATNWPIEKALHAIGYNQIPTK